MRRTVSCTVAVLLCLVVVPPGVQAVHPALQDPPDKRIEITAFGGYGFGGCVDVLISPTLLGEACPDAGPAFGGVAAYRVSNTGLMGGSFMMERTNQVFTAVDALTGTPTYRRFPVNIGYVHFVGEAEFPRTERFVPFIGLGVGAMYFEPRNAGNMGWFFSAAFLGGAKYKLTDNFGLRAQMTLLVNVISGSSNIFCVSSGGLTCAFATRLEGMVQGNALAGVYFTF